MKITLQGRGCVRKRGEEETAQYLHRSQRGYLCDNRRIPVCQIKGRGSLLSIGGCRRTRAVVRCIRQPIVERKGVKCCRRENVKPYAFPSGRWKMALVNVMKEEGELPRGGDETRRRKRIDR
jgi:hypothetical protein